MRKLRRGRVDAEGKTGGQIAANWARRLYNWRRAYGGSDTAAKELKELREQNSRLERLLAETELEKDGGHWAALFRDGADIP